MKKALTAAMIFTSYALFAFLIYAASSLEARPEAEPVATCTYELLEAPSLAGG